MLRWHCTIIFTLLFIVNSSRAVAQNQGDVAQLQEALQAQQTLNQTLLERLEDVETTQAALLKKFQSLEASVPNADEFREERDEILDDMREEYFELQEKLDDLPTISGYYDFDYLNDDRSESPGEFRVHHVGLQFAKEYENVRFFTEIEFEYGAKFEGTGSTNLETARGEIKVHQAWADYTLSDTLSLRGGLILVPTFWGVNHAPFVQLPTRRPLLFRKILPNNFAGLMAHGSRYWEDFGMTYYGYVGNGVSDNFAKDDDNEGKAVGGKVALHLPSNDFLDTFDLSLNVYHESPNDVERVNTWGVEAQIRKGPWEMLAEYVTRDSAVDRAGFFAQPSYRFNDKWATFFRYDLFNTDRVEEVQEYTLGFNYRPIPEVSFKLEYFYSMHSQDEDYNGIAASIAMAF